MVHSGNTNILCFRLTYKTDVKENVFKTNNSNNNNNDVKHKTKDEHKNTVKVETIRYIDSV